MGGPATGDPSRAEVPVIGNVWESQGPSVILNGQVEHVVPDDTVVGAIHTVLAHPTDADVLYIGAVNGGIWKTVNATERSPHWQPLTDHLGSLSIGAMVFDPLAPSTLLAGIGRFSSFGRRAGGDLNGLLLTRDAGETWTPIAHPLLLGENISGVAIRGQRLLVSANGFAGAGGVFRSEDGGSTWAAVSGSGGLPRGGAMDLVGDPTDSNRFYVSVRSRGIFLSEDGGSSWRDISAQDAALSAAIGDTGNNNAEMAVAANGRLYLGVLVNGQARYIGFTDDRGVNWTAMDLPLTPESDGHVAGLNPRVKPGGQGAIHFAIRADPIDAGIVYVGGDRQDFPMPNFIGAEAPTGRLFRGDTRIAPTGEVPSPQWEHLTHSDGVPDIPGGGTASGSAPHADSREMVFDARGDLIEVDDGGIYRRTSPRSNRGDWFSLNRGLQVTEMHDVAYDTVSNIILSGNQDTGTSQQTAPASATWDTVSVNDGGDVAVDASGAPEQSIRYSSFQRFLGFRRITYDANNQPLSREQPSLLVDGVSLYDVDPSLAFVQRFELNAVDPSRGVLGTASVYETLDRFDTLREVLVPDEDIFRRVSATAYGCGTNADLLYVGFDDGMLLVREGGGEGLGADGFQATGYAGGAPVDLVIDPGACATVYAVDAQDVYVSNDTGATWRNVTGNLAEVPVAYRDLRNIEFIPGGVFARDAVLAVAGRGGVQIMDSQHDGRWFDLGIGLPNAPVWDLDYDPADQVLVAGTLGRGAWLLPAKGVVLTDPLADRTLEVDDEPMTVDLSNAFRHTAGSALTYAAVSSDPAVAAVALTGGLLAIVPKAAGAARVTVTATDDDGLQGMQTFTVAVGAVVAFTARAAAANEGQTVRFTVRLSRSDARDISVGYAFGVDDSDSTADADDSDYIGVGGTVIIPAGETSAVVEISITDDDAAEAPRETFAVILDPPGANADYALGWVKSATVTIREGVCDRTPQVREMLRRDFDCSAVDAARLGTFFELYLEDQGIDALRAGDFAGLSGLGELWLTGNELTTLPAGVFAGLDNLDVLELSGNRLTSLRRNVFADLVDLDVLTLDGNRLSALPAGIFRGLNRLDMLLLNDNRLTVLPEGVFEDLARLDDLRLHGNRLGDLPPGLFSGLAELDSLRLDGNPGAPFALALELVRTDTGDGASASSATVAVTVAEGAPFDMVVGLSASAGTLSSRTASILAGQIVGLAVSVTRSGEDPVVVGLGTVPDLPAGRCRSTPCFRGIEIVPGDPLTLFEARPEVVAAIRGQTLEVAGEEAVFDLSKVFRDADGDPLAYSAESSDPTLVVVRVADGLLTLVPNSDDVEGVATVTVTATDSAGLAATLRFTVQVDPRIRGFWRGWRSAWLAGASRSAETPAASDRAPAGADRLLQEKDDARASHPSDIRLRTQARVPPRPPGSAGGKRDAAAP